MNDEHLDALAQYWRSVMVSCDKARLRGHLAKTDLARLWSVVGMPAQDWWLFNFDPPPSSTDDEVPFGFFGEWRLFYRVSDNSCFEMDLGGKRRFANSSIGAFAKMLTLWDGAYRRIQNECPGDTGDEWADGDVIVDEMKRNMVALDERAFESDSLFWPTLIADMA